MPRGWGLQSAAGPAPTGPLWDPQLQLLQPHKRTGPPHSSCPFLRMCLELHGFTPPVLPTDPLWPEPQTGHPKSCMVPWGSLIGPVVETFISVLASKNFFLVMWFVSLDQWQHEKPTMAAY